MIAKLLTRWAWIVIYPISLAAWPSPPAPVLKIPPDSVTYLRFDTPPRIIIAAGAGFHGKAVVNDRPDANGDPLAVKLGEIANPSYVAALQAHILDRIMSEAKQRGLTLADATQLGDKQLQPNEQMITLHGILAGYLAVSPVRNFKPHAHVQIVSSRDPVLADGERRLARVASVDIDDKKYQTIIGENILDNPGLFLEGIDIATDAMADKVVDQLVDARTIQ